MLRSSGAVAALFIAGCTANIASTPFHDVLLADYTLDEIRETTVGQPIFELERTAALDAYEVRFDYTSPSLNSSSSKGHEFQKGDRFTSVGHDPADPDHLFLQAEEDDQAELISIHADGTVHEGWVLTSGNVPAQGEWTESRLFEKSDVPTYGSESLYVQMLYSGVEGNTVRATYREFSNDAGDPQFTQELAYDLSISKIIAYRTIRIEVMEATNSELRYRVISEGDLDWALR